MDEERLLDFYNAESMEQVEDIQETYKALQIIEAKEKINIPNKEAYVMSRM